jgi:hypothetical protein
MKKSYDKPTIVRRDKLSKVTAIPSDSLILVKAE